MNFTIQAVVSIDSVVMCTARLKYSFGNLMDTVAQVTGEILTILSEC
jgi:hypothetical protein